MEIYFYSPKAEITIKTLTRYEDLISQTRGLECWIHMTYFFMKYKQTVFQPILTDIIPQRGIIVFHKGFFSKELKPNNEQFFVCIQADRGRHKFAQMHIVQNPYQTNNIKISKKSFFDRIFSFTNSSFISHWPQPSLITRDSNRGNKIENISFFGNKEQIPSDLILHLNSKSINFKTHFEPSSWNNYKTTDIALAIRSFDNSPYYTKPYSKIVNSILSDTLIIASPESSSKYFKQKYYPELQIVSSEDDLEEAIDFIIKNPEASFEALRKCRTRIDELTEDGVLLKWISTFDIAISKFESYKRSPRLYKSLFFIYRSL